MKHRFNALTLQHCIASTAFPFRFPSSPFVVNVPPVKPRRRKTTFAVVLGLAIVAAAILATRDDEPYYQGKSLSAWLETADGRRHGDVGAREVNEARQAIRAMGDDALPVLLRWLDSEPRGTWYAKLYDNLPARLRSNRRVYEILVGRGVTRMQLVAVGFRVLGTNATSLLPELETRMNNPSEQNRSLRAVIALAEIGVQALPALTNALANPTHRCRELIADRLSYMAATAQPESTNMFRPVLDQMLNDSDANVRALATNAVRTLAPDTPTYPPAN
jgi:hypothetical protein